MSQYKLASEVIEVVVSQKATLVATPVPVTVPLPPADTAAVTKAVDAALVVLSPADLVPTIGTALNVVTPSFAKSIEPLVVVIAIVQVEVSLLKFMTLLLPPNPVNPILVPAL